MRSRLSEALMAISLGIVSLLLVAAGPAYGQGRGHGGGHGGGGGRPGGGSPPMQRGGGGGRQPSFNPPQQRQMPQQNRGWQMQQRAQQPRPQRQDRGWQMQQRAQQPRPQRQDRGWQMQQRAQQLTDLGRADRQRHGRFDRVQNNAQWQRPGRSGFDNSIIGRGPQRGGRLNSSWSDRRAQMNFNHGRDRSERSFDRGRRGGWQNSFSDNNWNGRRDGRGFDRRDFDRRDGWNGPGRGFWRERRLRNTIINVIYGNSGRYYDYYPPYDPYSYDPYYYGAPFNTSYLSVNFGVYPEYSGYYNDYAAYSYYPDPYYPVDYEPYDPGYYDPYYDDAPYVSNYDPYYGYPTPLSYDYEPFAYYTEAGYPDPFIDDGDYCSLDGSHFEIALPGTFTQLLASGYDQGYSDGLYARRKHYGDRYYYDPYVYEDSGYDPYSYSLGENRRCLSEGYQLGYRDALYGSDQYEPLEDGNVDLVSLLMGNALQTVNYAG